MLLIVLHKKSVPYLTEKLQIFLLVINENYDLYEQYSSVIWSCDYNMSSWDRGLKKPISRAMKIEEKWKAGSDCRNRGRKICVHSLHQDPCQPWLFICKSDGLSSLQAKRWEGPRNHNAQQTPKEG